MTERWASEASGLRSANKGQPRSLVSKECPNEKLTQELMGWRCEEQKAVLC